MKMIDTWVRSTDLSALTSFLAPYKATLGPKLSSGYYYACVRSESQPTISSPLEQITEKDGGTVLGKWFSQQTPNYARGVNIDGLEWGTWNGGGTQNVSQSSVNDFADFGCRIIRLPFMWERVQPTLSGALDSTYLGKIKTAVGCCIDRGMHVILDCHNYARYQGILMFADGGPTQANFVDLWTRLAKEFAYNDLVSFDLMNEPDAVDTTTYMTAQQAVITAIRTQGFKGKIFVTGVASSGWSVGSFYSSDSASPVSSLTDTLGKLVVDLHQYIDTLFNGSGTTAVTGSVAMFENSTSYARSHGLKLFLGEIGVVNNAQFKGEVASVLSYLASNSDVWVGWTPWGGGPYGDATVIKLSRMDDGSKNPQMIFLSDYLR